MVHNMHGKQCLLFKKCSKLTKQKRKNQKKYRVEKARRTLRKCISTTTDR